MSKTDSILAIAVLYDTMLNTAGIQAYSSLDVNMSVGPIELRRTISNVGRILSFIIQSDISCNIMKFHFELNNGIPFWYYWYTIWYTNAVKPTL